MLSVNNICCYLLLISLFFSLIFVLSLRDAVLYPAIGFAPLPEADYVTSIIMGEHLLQIQSALAEEEKGDIKVHCTDLRLS